LRKKSGTVQNITIKLLIIYIQLKKEFIMKHRDILTAIIAGSILLLSSPVVLADTQLLSQSTAPTDSKTPGGTHSSDRNSGSQSPGSSNNSQQPGAGSRSGSSSGSGSGSGSSSGSSSGSNPGSSEAGQGMGGGSSSGTQGSGSSSGGAGR